MMRSARGSLGLTRRVCAHIAAAVLLTAGAPAVSHGDDATDAPTISAQFELIMVEQPSCAYCDKWLEEIGPIYPKTAEGRAAPLRRVDLFDPIPEDLAIAKAVQYTPTFLVTDKGREVGRIEGYTREDFFWGLLEMELRGAGALGAAP